MMKKILLFFLFLLLLAAIRRPATAAGPEIRALWVTNQQLLNPARIDRLIDYASAYNFNLLFVQVRRGGEVYFNSRLEPKAAALADNGAPPDFDPLAYVLAAAQPKGLAVHAWLNVYYLATPAEFPANGSRNGGPVHVRLRYPDWLLRSPGAGRSEDNSQYAQQYLSPSQPSVNQHILSLCRELTEDYRIDGLHLDYVRYPSAASGLTPENRTAFRQQYGFDPDDLVKAPASVIDRFGYDKYSELKASWQQVCARPVSDLVRQIRLVLTEAKPRIILSAAVVPEADPARSQNYQDWAGWVKDGLVDFVVPMCYSTDSQKVLAQMTGVAKVAGGSPAGVVVGLGAWRLTPDNLLAKTKLVLDFRQAGQPEPVLGVCFFSYDKLFPDSAYGRLLKRTVFAEPAPLPQFRRTDQYAGTF